MNRIQQQAQKAKDAGYEYITSVVKSYMGTVYYHYVSVDRVIEAGKWIPASLNSCGWRGQIGVTAKNLPAKTISKQDLYHI